MNKYKVGLVTSGLLASLVGVFYHNDRQLVERVKKTFPKATVSLEHCIDANDTKSKNRFVTGDINNDGRDDVVYADTSHPTKVNIYAQINKENGNISKPKKIGQVPSYSSILDPDYRGFKSIRFCNFDDGTSKLVVSAYTGFRTLNAFAFSPSKDGQYALPKVAQLQ